LVLLLYFVCRLEALFIELLGTMLVASVQSGLFELTLGNKIAQLRNEHRQKLYTPLLCMELAVQAFRHLQRRLES
jgi:hypothetical protein